MDFPRLSRQVMTWFIVDLQSRVWLDRKGEASDPFWLHVKDGGKLLLHKLISVLLLHTSNPYSMCSVYL